MWANFNLKFDQYDRINTVRRVLGAFVEEVRGVPSTRQCLQPAEFRRRSNRGENRQASLDASRKPLSPVGRLRRGAATALVLGATAAATLTLDVTWLGVVAGGLYDSALGPVKRSSVFFPAAALFYALYVAVVVRYAVDGASSLVDAGRRGATLGFVVYASYELTNWAVLSGWPAFLVPLDVGWGVVLTAAAAVAGKFVQKQLQRADG